MALIMKYAIQNQEFLTITGTLNYTIPATNMSGERTLSTHNAMMVPGDYYYEGTFSGKPGNTNEAGSTLVTCTERNDMTLICVVMKSSDGGQSTADTISLMDYGYNNFALVDVAAQQSGMAGSVVLPNGIDFSSLTVEETGSDSDGQTATATYSYQGQYLGAASSTDEKRDSEGENETTLSPSESPSLPESSDTSARDDFSGISYLLIGVLSLMILAGIVAIILGLKKNKKRKKKRR